jgi:hypothetical protein
MTTPRGTSLPRLQEFSFLEYALAGVVGGLSYEEIRKRLISYMQQSRQSDTTSGNTAKYQLERPGRFAYADNVTEALKELMRAGLVEPAKLPSGASTVRHYEGTTFAPTDAGRALAAAGGADRTAARDQLLGRIVSLHPQIAGYLRLMARGGLVIPLTNWGQVKEPRSRDAYVRHLAETASRVLAAENAGWVAEAPDIEEHVRAYVERLVAGATRRGRPDPYTRNEDFVRQCEKAMVRLAFERAGTPMDYITHEIIRRWLRDTDIAAFSYHVPGPLALRLWGTASVSGEGDAFSVTRRAGEPDLEAVVGGLREGYDVVRATSEVDSPWIPIYRLRAAVCYRLRVSDRVFDAAINDLLHERRGADLPFKVNVELYEYGVTPPSERPLRVTTKRGQRDVHTLALVPRLKEVQS